MTGREKFLAKLKPYLSPKELENINTAYMFSKYGHRTQLRDGSKVRYFDHPRDVALILIDELKITNWKYIVTALLHDILEDSFIISECRLRINFGNEVASNIRLLTKNVPEDEYLKRLKKSGNHKVITIKLCDRLHNLRSLHTCSKEKQKRYIKATREKYLPLIDVLKEKLPLKYKKIGSYLDKEIRKVVENYS